MYISLHWERKTHDPIKNLQTDIDISGQSDRKLDSFSQHWSIIIERLIGLSLICTNLTYCRLEMCLIQSFSQWTYSYSKYIRPTLESPSENTHALRMENSIRVTESQSNSSDSAAIWIKFCSKKFIERERATILEGEKGRDKCLEEEPLVHFTRVRETWPFTITTCVFALVPPLALSMTNVFFRIIAPFTYCRGNSLSASPQRDVPDDPFRWRRRETLGMEGAQRRTLRESYWDYWDGLYHRPSILALLLFGRLEVADARGCGRATTLGILRSSPAVGGF